MKEIKFQDTRQEVPKGDPVQVMTSVMRTPPKPTGTEVKIKETSNGKD